MFGGVWPAAQIVNDDVKLVFASFCIKTWTPNDFHAFVFPTLTHTYQLQLLFSVSLPMFTSRSQQAFNVLQLVFIDEIFLNFWSYVQSWIKLARIPNRCVTFLSLLNVFWLILTKWDCLAVVFPVEMETCRLTAPQQIAITEIFVLSWSWHSIEVCH